MQLSYSELVCPQYRIDIFFSSLPFEMKLIDKYNLRQRYKICFTGISAFSATPAANPMQQI